MSSLLRLAGLMSLALATCACAAPGSGMVRISVEGQVVRADGAPDAGRELRIVLPAGYGLRGMDAVWGEPGDYGHRDQMEVLRTDADGRFAGDLGGTTHTMMFWIIPPLGFAFQGPPDPVLFVRVLDGEQETYRVLVEEEEVKTATFLPGSREPVDRPPRYVFTGGFSPEEGAERSALRVRLRLQRTED